MSPDDSSPKQTNNGTLQSPLPKSPGSPKKSPRKHLNTPHLIQPSPRVTNLHFYKSSSIGETEHYILSVLLKKYAPFIDLDEFIQKLPYDAQIRMMQKLVDQWKGENAMGTNGSDDAIQLATVIDTESHGKSATMNRDYSSNNGDGEGSAAKSTVADPLTRVIRSRM
uniref:Uncharacterized protein n=1 Tax=Percolomonas cosmopolitus TaxID=63605 RepID=A0A7S1KSY0_9EUKA